MNQLHDIKNAEYLRTRREFLRTTTKGLGAMAMGSLMFPDLAKGNSISNMENTGLLPNAANGILNALHHSPKAKRVIYLFQSGGPSQIELFD